MSQTSAKKNNPLEFLISPRSLSKKRKAKQRCNDFDEIYIAKPAEELTQQASRCIDCGNPYCEWKCPLHNYIPNWLELTRNGQFNQAAELMHETNPLPEICGRVCPQDRLCEQACTLQTGFGAITIGAIEKQISDRALDEKWRPYISNIPDSGKKVAIVGAGPAGLGCAELLVRHGVKPIVFDKYPEIGGLLTFGIPNFKLDKSIIQRRREYLEDLGVEFQLNTEVGKDIAIDDLQNEHDAIFLAMGCYKSVTGKLNEKPIKGVIKALDFLITNINQQKNFGLKNLPKLNVKNKNIVVLGGGDTAMDCVRTAVRLQAKSVSCVYRRDKASMPGSPQEVVNATEEGVKFLFNRQPVAINEHDGKLSGVTLAETEIEADNNGSRHAFSVNKDKTSEIKADIVILAFGFQASPAPWLDTIGIKLKGNGLVQTRNSKDYRLPYSQQTSSQGIFAGGDMVRGADLVVTAIAEGRQAAREILEFIKIN